MRLEGGPSASAEGQDDDRSQESCTSSARQAISRTSRAQWVSTPGVRRGSSAGRVAIVEPAQRMLPVWPKEYVPGCGHTAMPCGPALTRMDLSRWPVVVSRT